MRAMRHIKKQSKKPAPRKRSKDTTMIFGKHAVDLALESVPAAIRSVYLAPNFSEARVAAKIKRLGCPVRPLEAGRWPHDLPQTANHQGIAASLDTSSLLRPLTDFLGDDVLKDSSTLLLVLAEVQDPQNVGAMIRSAAAFGVAAVLLPQQQQAPVTGTVVKVSAGMAFRVPLVSIKNVNQAIEQLQERGVRVLGLAGTGSTSLYKHTFAQPTALVVGNEGTGLRARTASLCDQLVRIPLHPRCESLNAAAAVTASLAIWQKDRLG